MLRFTAIIVILLFVSCSEQTRDISQDEVIDKPDPEAPGQASSYIDLREVYSKGGLVCLSDLDPDIIIDLRYNSSNNFIGIQLYDTLSEAYLQKEVAERLIRCQRYLDSIKPGYKLKIFDAVRPLSVQVKMWNALDSITITERGKFVSNPVLGSVHNFGAAVDLTICDEEGEELDMGAGYDDFRKIAFPSMEHHFLSKGELTPSQVSNRKLLREVMRSQRFSNIPSEWWHFNAYSRITAESLYPALITESGKFEKRVTARNHYSERVKSDTLE